MPFDPGGTSSVPKKEIRRRVRHQRQQHYRKMQRRAQRRQAGKGADRTYAHGQGTSSVLPGGHPRPHRGIVGTRASKHKKGFGTTGTQHTRNQHQKKHHRTRHTALGDSIGDLGKGLEKFAKRQQRRQNRRAAHSSAGGGGSHHAAAARRRHNRNAKHHGKHGKHSRGSGNISYTPQGAYKPNYKRVHRQASDLVNSDINSNLRQIRQEARGASRQYRHGQRKIRTQGKRERGDLRHVFGEAADFLQNNRGEMNQRYDTAKGDTADLYNQLTATNDANTSKNKAAMQSEMDRMGINASTRQFNEDSNFLQGMGNTDKTNALANLGTQQSGADAVARMLGSTMQGEKVSRIGQSYNTQGDQLSDLRQNYTDIFKNLQGEAHDTRADRASQIKELMMQLEDQNYQRFADTGQSNFENAMAANAFNLDVDKFNFDVKQNRQTLIQQRAAQRRRLRKQQTHHRHNQSQQAGANILGGINNMFSNLFG